MTNTTLEPLRRAAITDASILKSADDVENRETRDSPILKKEVEKAVRMLKDERSPGVDNIPAEIRNTEDQASSVP